MRPLAGIAATFVLAGLVAGTRAAVPPAGVGADARSRWCEVGITMALSGREAAAESAFVALLSRAPGDASALNNLGNLHLRRGDPGLAMSFYVRAGEADTADAGIALNAAIALMLLGDDAGAQELAGEAVRRAGGVAAAADLLGLPAPAAADSASRGAGRVRMSRDHALELLRSAARAVPADTTRPGAPRADSSSARRTRAPLWRPAGARGSEAAAEPSAVYWKRP